MGLDIRIPIGLMFLLLGPILLGAGWMDGVRLSMYTGASMVTFGAIMFFLGVRGHRRSVAGAAPVADKGAAVERAPIETGATMERPGARAH